MDGLLPIIRRKRRPLIDVDGANGKPEGGGIGPSESPTPVPDVSAPVESESDASNEKGEQAINSRKRGKQNAAARRHHERRRWPAQVLEIGKCTGVNNRIAAEAHREIVTAVLAFGSNLP